MGNKELAATARGGDTGALMDLWAQVRRLAWRFIPRWRTAAEDAIDSAGLRLTIRDFLAELPEAQRRVLYGRYWLENPVDRKAHDAALRALWHPSKSRVLRELCGN